MPKTPALHCGNYLAGHTVHFIQGLRSVKKNWVEAKVEYLGSNIFQLELADGQILTRFNHQPARLIEHLECFEQGAAWFQSDFYLLSVETRKGRAMFSLSKILIGAFSQIANSVVELKF